MTEGYLPILVMFVVAGIFAAIALVGFRPSGPSAVQFRQG